jgi:hypothetical protein
MLLVSRKKARVFGSRARESNGNTGSVSETTIVIVKMFAGKIALANGTGVLRSWPGPHDQILIETATIESGEIGNAPIGGDRIVIDPIASGSPALLARRQRAAATATIRTGEIGSAPLAGIPIGTDPMVPSDPTPPGRKYRAIETVTSAVEKTGSVPTRELQIGSDGPAAHGQKDGRMIKVSSAPNKEKAGGIVTTAKELPGGRRGKIQPRTKDSRCADQAIPGTTDAGRMGSRSDPIARITKSLVPSDQPTASAPVQSQGAQSQDQMDVRARKPGWIVVLRGSTDRNRSGRAWPIQGETMIRHKPGE